MEKKIHEENYMMVTATVAFLLLPGEFYEGKDIKGSIQVDGFKGRKMETKQYETRFAGTITDVQLTQINRISYK